MDNYEFSVIIIPSDTPSDICMTKNLYLITFITTIPWRLQKLRCNIILN